LDETLYTAAEALRITTSLLSAVIPDSAAKIWSQLGFMHPLSEVRTKDLHWGHLPEGQLLGTVSGVFPRADKALIEKMEAFEVEEFARQQALLGKTVPPPAPEEPKIGIEDFLKIEMRVGMIKDAAAVKGSDKLLHLHVDIGEA